MSGLRYRVAYVPWWRPIRLAHCTPDGFEFIGWVWRAKARQVNNLHHGWIAFVEDQTPELLASCPHCNRPMDSARGALVDRVSRRLRKADQTPAAPTPSPPFPRNRQTS
ncbi:hypothetical protein [Nevskia sp.]|uniref:hypothetical protein n=1 Tax=Nevskia sp. TaxID=1929292 RepID=UPI0025FFCD95|nr:hypothetical protein [Nevskia sp.]